MQFLSELVKYFLEDLFFIFMKVLKKIGLGIISLGLISTFYIPEAKAGNRTILEFDVDGTTYAIKLVTQFNANTGKFLFKKVGSGSTSCKMWIGSVADLAKFNACVAAKIGGITVPAISSSILNELDL